MGVHVSKPTDQIHAHLNKKKKKKERKKKDFKNCFTKITGRFSNSTSPWKTRWLNWEYWKTCTWIAADVTGSILNKAPRMKLFFFKANLYFRTVATLHLWAIKRLKALNQERNPSIINDAYLFFFASGRVIMMLIIQLEWHYFDRANGTLRVNIFLVPPCKQKSSFPYALVENTQLSMFQKTETSTKSQNIHPIKPNSKVGRTLLHTIYTYYMWVIPIHAFFLSLF